MKTKKTYRLLSAVLAILMVFAVCPMFAISAADATEQADADPYWDGTVPGVTAGTSVLDFVLAGTAYTIDMATLEQHITFGAIDATYGSRDVTILDETGFAIFVILSNNPFTITGYNEDGSDLTGEPFKTVANMLKYKSVLLDKDLYLNNPANTDASTWNEIAPIFLRRNNANDANAWKDALTFDGQNHAIYGWYVNQTLTDSSMNAFGLFGSMLGGSLTVRNVALLNMKVELVAASTYSGPAVLVGGIVGAMWSYVGGALDISNIIVDMAANVTPPTTSNSKTHWLGTTYRGASIGGVIATQLWRPNAGTGSNHSNIKNFSVQNALLLIEANTTSTHAVTAGITNDLLLSSKLAGNTVSFDNIVVMFNGTGAANNTPTYLTGTPATLTATDVWATGSLNSAMTDASNKVVTLADATSDEYWATNSATLAGMSKLYYPVPTTMSKNSAVINRMTVFKSAIFATELTAGSESSIANADELVVYAILANELGKAAYIKLTANIDMAGKTMPVIYTLKSLDGDGHVISNLTINRTLTNSDVAKVGGFTDFLSASYGASGTSGTMKDVAFVNYSLNVDATARTTEYYVGGLFGTHGANSEVSNVYMQGELNINGEIVGSNGGRLGTFGAMSKHDIGNIGMTFTNCVFVGTASAPKAVAPFMEVLGHSNSNWAAIATASANYEGKYEILRPARQIKINNCYSLCYTVDEEGKFVNWQSLVGNNIGMQALALTNAYQVGMDKGHVLHHANSVNGYADVVDANGNSLAYLDQFNVGDVANGNGIETAWGGTDATYTLEQFQGSEATNAMIFHNASEWTWFADGTPIPAVFGDNASALSVKAIEGEVVFVTNWAINAATQIVYKDEITYAEEGYNAYYMERNVVTTFKEELNLALGTNLTMVQQTTSGSKAIYAYVDSTMPASEYDISITGEIVTVVAGHYAGLEEALTILKDELVKNNGILDKSFSKNDTTAITISGIANTFATYGANVNNYTLVWNDEFNASSVDYDRWCFDASNPAKNVDDIALSNSATTANGSLNMTTTLVNGVYNQSKLLTTFGTMNFNGGYLEMRANIPYEAIGNWASMWATSGNSALFIKEWKTVNNTTDAPSNATTGNGMGLEVDFVEIFSTNHNQSGVILYPSDHPNGTREQSSGRFEDVESGYHTYGFFWNSNYMVFTIDGQIHYTFYLKDTGTDTDEKGYVNGTAKDYYAYGDFAPGKIAMSLILQNDVFSPDYVEANSTTNGGWINPNSTIGALEGEPYNATLAIDYVRLYQCENDTLYLPRELGQGVTANGNFNWNTSPYPAN